MSLWRKARDTAQLRREDRQSGETQAAKTGPRELGRFVNAKQGSLPEEVRPFGLYARAQTIPVQLFITGGQLNEV